MNLTYLFGRAKSTLEEEGVAGLVGLIKRRIFRRSDLIRDNYRNWIKKSETSKVSDPGSMKRAISAFLFQPRISVLMPVYNSDERWLRLAIDSVRAQIYPHWELCIADDASTLPHVRSILQEYSEKDPRIKITYRNTNGHISAASNSALRLATGEFTALLDHDDELSPDALFWVVNEINRYPGLDLVYSDEDKIDATGLRHNPHFKPDWDPFLFCSYNLITHLACYRTQVIRNLNGFRVGFEGSQDYDLGLRVVEITPPDRIRHIPRVLYHWRAIKGSTAISPSEKSYATEASKRAIEEFLSRRGVQAQVLPAFGGGYHRVAYGIPDRVPVVSVVVCVGEITEKLNELAREILEQTDYRSIELIVVTSSASSPPSNAQVMTLCYQGTPNLSAMRNMAARNARGEILVFLSEGVKPIGPNWLTELVSFASRPEIGVTGARLLSTDGKVHHAGLVLGIGGVAGSVDRFTPRTEAGYMSKALLIHGVSAVTGECLAVKKRIFEEVGGFDEEHLPNSYSDVDLCLEVGVRGYKNVYTPYAEFYQTFWQTLRQVPETSPAARYVQTKWGESLARDPFYNPNLALNSESSALSFPPRIEFSFAEVRKDSGVTPARVFSGITMPMGQN